MIKLYTWKTPNGRKVSILLEELGMPYEVRAIDLQKDEQFSAEFSSITPNNKIPAIIDTDGPDSAPVTIFESGAILIYLAEKGRRFLPSSGADRYKTIQWLMFQMGGVGPMFGQTHHFRRYAKDQTYSVDRFTRETHRLYKVLNSELAKHEFVAGHEYSIADMAIYPWVARFDLHQIDWSEFANVKRWFDALSLRPAVQRGMEVPGS
jgi:GST-like protein